MRLLIRCIAGLEPLLEKEIRTIIGRGRSVATERPFPCAVTVSGPLCARDVYKLHYTSRLATHVWRDIGSSRLDRGVTEDALHNFLNEIEYPSAVRGSTVAVFGRNPARRSDFYFTDTLLDGWRGILAARHNARLEWDGYQVRLLVLAEKGNMFRVYAGDGDRSLHIRGLRKKQGVAPMNETLAAAMVSMASDTTADRPVIDPFCGSGTIILEYLMRLMKVPAQYFNPAYRDSSTRELLPPSNGFRTCTVGEEFDEEEWRQTIEEEDSKIQLGSTGPLIAGFDKDSRMVDYARSNLEPLTRLCGMASIPVQAFDWGKLSSLYGGAPVMMITNPPFGLRLSRSKSLIHSIGEFLRSDGSDGVIAVASADDVAALGCHTHGDDVTKVKVATVDTWLCRVLPESVSV
ncbi:hypothetical protein FOZ63_016369 [Perkinsus olseni]|uniref:Ribosomal RNA large subunit methyltransferase K/L-like methyltransferase domain-containing protein n=1 Tax=Perkinsus olseni TaxID=32597 RepID=A0A7J6TWQ9_PEROL|nr:hypothetical protein FOZ62_029103 [Perkinsus olseni]KAF4748846.1 hypothetical protein FOZ63_016369 [Perkinsus olseni]